MCWTRTEIAHLTALRKKHQDMPYYTNPTTLRTYTAWDRLVFMI